MYVPRECWKEFPHGATLSEYKKSYKDFLKEVGQSLLKVGIIFSGKQEGWRLQNRIRWWK